MTKYLLFASAFAVQAVYWHLLRQGFKQAQRQVASTPATPPVSVIVAARNEEKNLPGLLAALMRQDYPEYEIVIVDDASEDETARVTQSWPDADRRIKLVHVTHPVAPRKKNALTTGIEAAAHELLVFTDADCRPPRGWLRAMAATYVVAGSPLGQPLPRTRSGEGIKEQSIHNSKHLPPRPSATPPRIKSGAGSVQEGNLARPSELNRKLRPVLRVGYSPFGRRPGWLNRIARYETFVAGFSTAAAIGLGKPYMAVGRSMAYPRSAFEAIGGFEHSRQSLSGDDDLLVQEVVRRDAAAVIHVFDPAGFVPTDAPRTWRQWLRQKTRHTSASRFYARDVQAHLTLFHASNAALWLAPVFIGWTGAGLLGAKLAQQYFVLREAARVLEEEDLISRQPVLELLYTAYNTLIAPIGVLKMPSRW